MKWRRSRALYRLLARQFFSSPFLFRGLLCFAVGIIVYIASSQGNYDLRFNIRGRQDIARDVWVISISRDDFRIINHSQALWSLKEVVESSDGLFWNTKDWQKALDALSQAKAVAVSLFISSRTHDPQLFKDKNVIWAARRDADGRLALPSFANNDLSNVGLLEFSPDPDGSIRHFSEHQEQLINISTRLAHSWDGIDMKYHGGAINFRGPQGTFPHARFLDLINGKLSPSLFAGKLVIIGTDDLPTHMWQTPVGPLSTAELIANIVDNDIHQRWIHRVSPIVAIIILIAVLTVSIWVVWFYPQSAAFVFLGFFALILTALSAALFDLAAIWMPYEACLATMIAGFGVISSYRLGESEKLSWESEKELKYLGEVEALKNNFISLISHDLKNPLAKIQGVIDRLVSRNVAWTAEAKLDMDALKATCEELRQYISHILQLTRVEAHNIKLTKDPYDLNQLIEQVIERLKPLAQTKQINIKLDAEPLFSMELDKTLITEVIVNLIENAIKYSPPSNEVVIRTQEFANDVRFEVVDRGQGIPDAEIPKVFEKFYRGQSSESTAVTGSGLGLYLVKYFIELHGGKVFIHSRLGEGTTIGFTLPIEG